MNNESKPDLLYAFVYEAFDEGGWGPSYSLIAGQDIGEAFAKLGQIIQEFSLIIRNIHYGFSSEMQDEIQTINEIQKTDEWWRNRRLTNW